jgi:aspartyl-tRNA(Asn)/glutamyl-tRNA(Gln) amidotransferase subunit C
MDINDEMIDRLAGLAKLEFKADEKEAIRQDLQKIIGYIEKLNELDTENVEPLIFMTDEENVLRDDEVHSVSIKKEALENAPAKDSDYFRVPKFIDK